MSPKKRVRVNAGGFQHSNHEILGGKGKVFRVPNSGDVYQFQMWIPEEKKYLRKSLKTKDLETAMKRGEDLYLQTFSDVQSGRKLFGITLQELSDAYLKWREEDVALGNITKGRLGTMSSQMKHLLAYKGHQTKVSELDRNSCYEYEVWRMQQFPTTKKVTIRNEQATFNAMMKYAYRVGYSHLDTLDFRKMVIKGADISRRDTFTLEEYDRLVRYMRTYVSKRACPDETERMERMLVRDAILVASNTMLRVGELWNLKWKDILQIEPIFDEDERKISLVTIDVRPEISKTRKGRRVPVRGGEYLERIRARSIYTGPEDFVFCAIGKDTKPRVRFWYDHWAVLMAAIDIDYKKRNLTWYSLRHFGITCRIRAKVMLSDISQSAGTSVNHIETHYGHYDDDILRQASIKNFTVDSHGISFKD
ncbi:MAG: site-specific integrase [Chromatiales bacterium]|jgi:integrase|nr:site-specific integrase [Chromatiales bacterium]